MKTGEKQGGKTRANIRKTDGKEITVMPRKRRESFLMYHDWLPLLELLPLEEAGQVVIDVFEFAISGQDPDGQQLSSGAKMLYRTMRNALIRDGEKYEATCKQREAAARKRWEKEHPGENYSQEIYGTQEKEESYYKRLSGAANVNAPKSMQEMLMHPNACKSMQVMQMHANASKSMLLDQEHASDADRDRDRDIATDTDTGRERERGSQGETETQILSFMHEDPEAWSIYQNWKMNLHPAYTQEKLKLRECASCIGEDGYFDYDRLRQAFGVM